jgi:hypothetical protein
LLIEKSKGTFLHGYERGVASVVLMRCWGTVERSRFVVLCNRSMRAWRPCCDAKSQILIRVPSGFFADETAGAWKPRFVFCQERSDSVRARRPYVSLVLCTEWRKCHTQGLGHPYRGSKWRILFNRSSLPTLLGQGVIAVSNRGAQRSIDKVEHYHVREPH